MEGKVHLSMDYLQKCQILFVEPIFAVLPLLNAQNLFQIGPTPNKPTMRWPLYRISGGFAHIPDKLLFFVGELMRLFLHYKVALIAQRFQLRFAYLQMSQEISES